MISILNTNVCSDMIGLSQRFTEDNLMENKYTFRLYQNIIGIRSGSDH